MKVAIHQPHYLPWLGYIAKWAAADVFVLLDTVQFEKNGWQNRNRLKTHDGPQWLTVPVRARLGTPIRDVPVDAGQPWPRRHLATIEQAYAKSPCLDRYRDTLRDFYERSWTQLGALCAANAACLAGALGVRTPVRLASELDVATSGATARLVDLCRAVGGTTYLAGADGAKYVDRAAFAAAGITVLQQRYEHPEYRQLHGPFVPFLSALDILLMHGEDALPLLRTGDHWEALPE